MQGFPQTELQESDLYEIFELKALLIVVLDALGSQARCTLSMHYSHHG